LLSGLEKSTETTGKKARIVNTSSNGAEFAPGDGFEWEALKGSAEREAHIKAWGDSRIPGKGAIWKLYGMSKLVRQNTWGRVELIFRELPYVG